MAITEVQNGINALDSAERGLLSDGYHSFKELYEMRLALTVALFNTLHEKGRETCKSWKHSDGEKCFGGGWFIVMAKLPSGQISFHYPSKDWDKFMIPVYGTAPEWDGHTSEDVYNRLLEL